MSALEIIDAAVRDEVRRQGLDPIAQRDTVRDIVHHAVVTYGERSLVDDLPPLDDPATLTRTVTDVVAGFGPLQRYLDDPSIEEVWVNEPTKVFVARHGRSELTTTVLTSDDVRALVERMLKSSGRRIDFSNPFVDAMLPDGSRLHVVIPDITSEHWAVNIRKHTLRASGLADLIALGTLNAQAATFLEACAAAGLNILVSGGTQTGKTTLLNTLVAAVPARERVITCEEVFELRVDLPDVVRMQTRQASLEGSGEITLRHLVKEALRMRPQRIVVGEVRQSECLDLLISLNSGFPNNVETLLACAHAQSGYLRADIPRSGRRRARCRAPAARLPEACRKGRLDSRSRPRRQRHVRLRWQTPARLQGSVGRYRERHDRRGVGMAHRPTTPFSTGARALRGRVRAAQGHDDHG